MADELRAGYDEQVIEIMQTIPAAICAVDSYWHLTYVNKKAEEFLRHKQENLLGSLLWDLFPGIMEVDAFRELKRAMRERIPVACGVFSLALQTNIDLYISPLSSGGLTIYLKGGDATTQPHDLKGSKYERLMRLVAVTAHVSFWEWNAETDCITSLCILPGMPPIAPFTLAEALEKCHPDERLRLSESFQATLRGDKSFREEIRLLMPEGHLGWSYCEGDVQRDKDGKATSMIIVYSDISDRKKIEKLLEADMNAMSRLHSISTQYMREDNLGPLLNEIVDTALNISHADMCSIQYLIPQTGDLKIISQSGLSEQFIQIVDKMHNRQAVLAQVMTLERGLKLENVAGQPVPPMGEGGRVTMLHLGVQAMNCTPLMSRSGKKLGVLTTFFKKPHVFSDRDQRMMDLLARLTADIMDRVNSEEELQRSSRSTELLYEIVEKLLVGCNTQDVIREYCAKVMEFLGCDMFTNYLFTPDRSRLHLSTSAGLTPEEAGDFEWVECGQAVCGTVAAEGARMVLADVQGSSCCKVNLIKPIGIRAYACHPLTVQNEVLGTLAFGTRSKDSFSTADIALMRAVCGHVAVAINRVRVEDDLKNMTEELFEKNKLVTDFFTNISHEFKTPLSIILVDLQLMEYRLKDISGEPREKLGKMVLVMRQNALRLLRLIGNLLDVTKIDAGFMKARLCRTDVVEMVSTLVNSVDDYAHNAGISLSFASDVGCRLMPLDAEKVERVMLNLLSNAIKHTPEGGHINVGLVNDKAYVTISVKDDGEGIPADKKDFIFDRFRQVNTSLARASEGCGIGLSLTKALVDLLGGKIWFESRLGSGSEFFVRLPVLDKNVSSPSPEIEGMPRNRKVEMEFSDIHKAGKKN